MKPSTKPSGNVKLYVNREDPFSQRVAIVAAYKNFTGEFMPVPLHERDQSPEWYKEINPRGELPALQLPNGKCFSESTLIAQYLDESIEPRYELFPANAELRSRIMNIATATELLIAPAIRSFAAVDEELEAATADLRTALGKIERAMSTTSPFAVGDSFSLADAFVVPFLIHLDCMLPVFANFNFRDEFPRFQLNIAACMAIPAVAKTTPSPEAILRFMPSIGMTGTKPIGWKFHLRTHNGCMKSECVRLIIAQITRSDTDETKGNTLRDFFAEEAGAAADGDAPVLWLPCGEEMRGSENIVPFLAERFGYEVPNSHGAVKGLIPLSEPNAVGRSHALAEQVLEGRYFVDSFMRVASAVDAALNKRDRSLKIEGDVADELKNAERVYAAAGPKSKTFLFADTPSYFDFMVLPSIHRMELLMGTKALSALAPSLVNALSATRRDAVLGKCLMSSDAYMGGADRGTLSPHPSSPN